MPTLADALRYYQGDVSDNPEFGAYWSQFGDPPDDQAWWIDANGQLTPQAQQWFAAAQQSGDTERDRQADADKKGGFLGDLGPIAQLAGLIPGPQQPFVLAANAANNLSAGNPIGAALNTVGAYNTWGGGDLFSNPFSSGGNISGTAAAPAGGAATGLADAPWGVNPAADYGTLGQGEFAGYPDAGVSTGASSPSQYADWASQGGGVDPGTTAGLPGTGGSSLGAIGDWLGKVSPNTWLNLGGTLLGSGINYLGTTKAASAQQQAANNQIGLLSKMYEQNRADLAPWRQAGVGALGNLTNLTTPGKQFDAAMLDPGYAFRQAEGEKGINRAAAARGLWDSGRTYKALDRFNQDYATGEFGNVWNRNAALAGIGQTATNTGVWVGQNYGQQAGESMLQAANARASGYAGGAKAFSGGLSNLLNTYNENDMLDRILKARYGA